MPRESRHVWVGNLPESVKEEQVADYFSRYGRVEKIKLLPKISPDGGRAAFVDFVDIRSATKANEASNRMGDRDLRTNYNEPGNKQQQQQQHQQQPTPEFDRNHPVIQHHRIHPGYAPPPGLSYRQPVVIYAAPPPQVEHVIHAAPPYRPIQYHRDDRRVQNPAYQPRRDRGRSPASRGSLSDGDRSPSPAPRSRAGYSSGSDTSEKSGRSTVLVKHLLSKGTDTSLEEALYHEFKKYGEILNINIKGTGPERYAYVQFSKPDEAESATRSHSKIFLGQEMKVTIKGATSKSRSSGGGSSVGVGVSVSSVGVSVSGSASGEDLAFDPHATRTVFVGNLDKAMMHGELRNIFERFGEVVDVDIKKMQTGITTYAFVQFIDINGATLAKRKMDRQAVGNNRIKVGYGRGTPTNSLWVGNLPVKVTEHDISKLFHPFGYVQRCLIDKKVWQALVRFETIEACTKAFAEMHGKSFSVKRLAVDYASPACRNAFYNRMERHGFLDRRQLQPSPTPPDAHINFQNAARGGPFQPRDGQGVFGSNIQPRDPPKTESRPDRYSDRFEKDGGESRTRDRSRGYSPMSRTSNSPKRGISRESISPVRSDRNESRKRSRQSPQPGIEPPKKKEKKKKKDKKDKSKKNKAGKGTLELGFNMNEDEEPTPPAPVPKSKADLKKEKKEKKKAEKVRKKAEKKVKKLKKLKSLEEKLSSIEAAVNEGVADEKPIPDDDTNNEIKITVESITEVKQEPEEQAEIPTSVMEAVSEVSEGEGPSEVKDKDNDSTLDIKMENVVTSENNSVDDNSKETISVKEEEKESSPVKQDPPASPDQVTESPKSPPPDRRKEQKPVVEDSSDSSSSSSSSSESDDSDDSSDDDRNSKNISKKNAKERDSLKQRRTDSEERTRERPREPKAYRQDRNDDTSESERREYQQRREQSKDSYTDRDRERERERDREREYSRSKYTDYYRSSSNKSQQRNKSPSTTYRNRSRSRSPYKRDDRSPFDRRRGRSPVRTSPRYDARNEKFPQKIPPPPPPAKESRIQQPPSGVYPAQNTPPTSQSTDTLLDLLRRFPVMWQGLLGLKNDTAAVQMHFLSGNVRLAESSLPRAAHPHEVPPPLRISQRMKLEPSQLDGVDQRIQQPKEHCMLLALPCGRDPLDVHAQTRALKTGFITYLQQKQAAGIINVPNPSTKQPVYVVHIFPPCEFAQGHLVRVAPDLLDSAVDSGHLMVLITPI